MVVSKKHYDESKVELDEKQLLERKIIMAQRTLDRLNLKLSVAKGWQMLYRSHLDFQHFIVFSFLHTFVILLLNSWDLEKIEEYKLYFLNIL